jgi:uncharacterized protein with GYD domain
MEDDMPTFILTINWTDQGIRAVRDAPKRSQAARELAKKVGVEIKEIYLTSGEHDLLVIAEAPFCDGIESQNPSPFKLIEAGDQEHGLG